MHIRPDISDKLVHFTSGDSSEQAYQKLKSIISQRCLIGSSEKLKGGFRCVCFSEAPLINLSEGLVNPTAYSRYSPFGILVSKKWLFNLGGRPVIYQSDNEYDAFPESIRWRHVRYEPNIDNPIDFTWEREWRIHIESLRIDFHNAVIVMPDDKWAQRLHDEHKEEQDFKIYQYKQVLDEDIAEQYREEFGWRIYRLN